jgi:hypothetical protein
MAGAATRAERFIIALSIAAAPALAIASETINYTYDAKGRLVKVERFIRRRSLWQARHICCWRWPLLRGRSSRKW